ncbi:MAG TPA: PAS domain S-box protein [Anaerolineae bacterium]
MNLVPDELTADSVGLEALFEHAPAALALFDARPPYRVLAHSRVYQQLFPEPFCSEGMVGKVLPDYLAPEQLEQILAIFHEVVQTGREKVIENFAYDGLPRGRTWWNWHLAPVFRDGKVVALAHMAVDVTEQVQARQAQEAELAERKRVEAALMARARQQAVVARLGQQALGGQDLDVLMQAAAARVAETLRVEYCKVLELLPDGQALLLRAGVGWHEAYPVGQATVSAGLESQAGYALVSKEPVIVDDLRTETRFSGPSLLHVHRVVSGISVIIAGSSGPWGVMGAHTERHHRFTRHEVNFLQSVANVLAMAIERERTEAELRRERAQLKLLNETLEEKVERRTRALQEANEELQAARDLFYTLFHTSPIPICITRMADGRYVDANEAFLRYFGWRHEEVIGRTSLELGLWQDTAERGAWIDRFKDTGSLGVHEAHFRHPSGETRTTLSSLRIVEVGGERCALTAFFDITERAIAEQQVRALASELVLAEQRERRRIAQILHDELQQMLVALKMSMDLLGQKARPALRAEMQAAAELAGEIIDVTRTLAVDLSAPVTKSENMADACRWLADIMRERYQLQVTLQVAPDIKVPSQDVRELLLQLMREVLFNVVKHAGVDQARLYARERGEALVIRIEDDGNGFNADAALAWQDQSAGFGLFSVRERLGLFGGDLQVDSVPGAGTRVTITIPKKSMAVK